MRKVEGLPSGKYDWRDRPLNKRAQANVVMSKHIRKAHRASDEIYGMPRIRAELTDSGIIASRKCIARLMRASRKRNMRPRKSLGWKCPSELFLPERAFDFRAYWTDKPDFVALWP